MSVSISETELDQQLRGGLRFIDEESIKLQDGALTFKAKPELSMIQFAILFQKVRALGGSYNNLTRSFTVKSHTVSGETMDDTARKTAPQSSASNVSDDTVDTVETQSDTLSLFQRIERQLAVSDESLDVVAKKLGVGRATVAKVKKILRAAPEEVKQDCRRGRRTINSAYSLIRDAAEEAFQCF
jgi:biotin operon repressor